MVVTTLDTHESVKELLAAGFTGNIDLSNLATKADLDGGLAAAKADLEVGLAEPKAEILKWMVGSIGVQTVVILWAVVGLARTMVR